MTPIGNAINDGDKPTVVACMGSQMGKTELMLNCIGQRTDDDPVPTLYIAPTKSFIEGVFEPRFRAMVEQCASLNAKRRPGLKEKKTVKHIAGVKIRCAWSGSATEMAGDPACKVYVDERDRMDDNVSGEGDPVALADARHDTYPDGQTIVVSTPTMGTVDTYVDEETGLEFWGRGDEIQSATWKLFQQGTGYHWAVPCPHCDDFFIPRFRLLTWPEGCTAYQAKKQAKLMCPQCGTLIDQEFKDDMNALGVYVAPGQCIEHDGTVTGDPPASDTVSFWVSGLMSAWKSWGDRAQSFLQAVRSGDPDRIQAVINTGMGELYSIKGEAPELDAVRRLRQPYKSGEVHPDVRKIVMTVDVQKAGLYYVVRGWGHELESWKIESGYLVGATDGDQVWSDLEKFKDFHYGGLPIERLMIDSGYRTQFVYAFCRKFRAWAFPTKGRDTIDSTPLQKSKLDVGTNSGKRLAGGLGIWHINTDYFKRWIHERIERDPTLPGGFHLPEDTDEDYCRQLVSEARIVKPSGKVVWQRIFKDNHYFDCEVLQVAGAYSLGLQTLVQSKDVQKRQSVKPPPVQKKRRVDPFRTDNRQGPRGSGGGWFNGGR